MNIRYRVEMSQAERSHLETMLKGGTHAARKLKRAQILLAADAGCCDAGTAPQGSILLGLGVGALVIRRRRRRNCKNL